MRLGGLQSYRTVSLQDNSPVESVAGLPSGELYGQDDNYQVAMYHHQIRQQYQQNKSSPDDYYNEALWATRGLSIVISY